MKYSIIIPVYNRPEEVAELLQSITRQTLPRDAFEVIVVEDGSSLSCKKEVERYANLLRLRYFEKPNSGPGPSRNYGAERAEGDYLIILDSDVELPDGYLSAVDTALRDTPCEAFGGPDAANTNMTQMQRAISYAMTSFFTTGGIRGGKRKLDKFYPRSFNMGVRRDVYQQLGGFSKMRFGEDIDLSYRIFEHGYTARLFPTAWVWHKRRTDLDKFFKQVFNSGIARINLTKRHPGSLKLVHLLPTVFTVGCVLLIAVAVALRLLIAEGGAAICPTAWLWPLAPVLLFILIIFVDASLRQRSLVVGFLAVEASFVQLFGYGLGFLKAWWQRCVRGRGEFAAYEKNFYD